jgi:uncharacterized protein YgiM (DUF1202 family)
MKRVAILAVLLFVACVGITAMAAENATITGDGLRLREHPTTNAGVLASMNKGTRVEVLAHTEFTESIDGFTGYWYKIVYNGMVGYVFGKYIIPDAGVYVPGENEVTGKPPTSPDRTAANIEDILGDWPMYYDIPNETFSFYPDMTAKSVRVTFSDDGIPDENTRVITSPPVWGTYTFDGFTINVTWNDGTTSTFIVEKEYGVTSLYLNGQLLPPELHMLSPDEVDTFHQYD